MSKEIQIYRFYALMSRIVFAETMAELTGEVAAAIKSSEANEATKAMLRIFYVRRLADLKSGEKRSGDVYVTPPTNEE